jgi:hypothetical protein
MVALIALFSIGEMLSSPKFLEFIGNFAPHDKKGMYLGFSQIPLAVGWTLEGKLGPTLYGIYASKDKFSRELLLDRLREGTAAIPADQALVQLAEQSTLTTAQVGQLGQVSPQELVAAIPQGEAFDWLVAMTPESAQQLTDTLYATHNIAMVWYIMGAVGLLSAICIYLYGKWILTSVRHRDARSD